MIKLVLNEPVSVETGGAAASTLTFTPCSFWFIRRFAQIICDYRSFHEVTGQDEEISS